MNILVLNAGSAFLKFEVIATLESPSASDKQRKLVSGIIEGIGEEATFSLLENKQTIQQEKIAAPDYVEATRHVLKWLDKGRWQNESTSQRLDALGHLQCLKARVRKRAYVVELEGRGHRRECSIRSGSERIRWMMMWPDNFFFMIVHLKS
jgi:acetate kinase